MLEFNICWGLGQLKLEHDLHRVEQRIDEREHPFPSLRVTDVMLLSWLSSLASERHLIAG